MRRAGLLLLCLLLPATALAQSPRDVRDAERTAQDRRQAAEAAAREAQRRAEEEVRLAGQRVEAAQRAQAAEAELLAASDRAEAARNAAAASSAAFRARNEAFRPLLPVMMRLSLWPVETVLAVPAEPEEALRGALVLRGLVRRLEDEAAALREAGAATQAALALAEREQAALAAADQRAAQRLLGLGGHRQHRLRRPERQAHHHRQQGAEGLVPRAEGARGRLGGRPRRLGPVACGQQLRLRSLGALRGLDALAGQKDLLLGAALHLAGSGLGGLAAVLGGALSLAQLAGGLRQRGGGQHQAQQQQAGPPHR